MDQDPDSDLNLKLHIEKTVILCLIVKTNRFIGHDFNLINILRTDCIFRLNLALKMLLDPDLKLIIFDPDSLRPNYYNSVLIQNTEVD